MTLARVRTIFRFTAAKHSTKLVGLPTESDRRSISENKRSCSVRHNVAHKMDFTLKRSFSTHTVYDDELAAGANTREEIESMLRDKKISLVIFDKDGTLICFDSMWVPWAKEIAKNIEHKSQLENIESSVYKILGYCPVLDTVKTGMLAENTMQQIKNELTSLLVENGLHQEEANKAIERAWLNCDTTKPGALQALGDLVTLFKALKQNGTKIAICTSDSRAATVSTLNQLGLISYIDALVCGNDSGVKPKPDPDTALSICDKLNVAPNEAMMVGDTVVDVQMAKSAGLGVSVGVLSGVGRAQELAKKSDILLESVQHLAPHFQKSESLVTNSMPLGSKKNSGLLSRLAKNVSSFVKSAQAQQYSTTSPSSAHASFLGRRRTYAIRPLPEDVKPTHIIVGGGSAGCVLANRLTENPDNCVFLIEAGPSDDWWRWKIHMPSALMYNLANNRYNWYYHTLPQTSMNNRVMYCPRGRVWGGSSALNAMVYIRGHANDYDRWAYKEGATGWSYAECLPYFKKSESFDGGADDYRGDSGPLHVHRFDGKSNPLYSAFIEAGVQAGYGRTDDMNGYKQEGFGYMDASIYKGKRWSASQAYLWPIINRPNFFYENRCLVSRVIMDRHRAAGVETVGATDAGSEFQERKRFYTEKDVVLCAGAINSPQILMLSGIGHQAVLRSVEIPVHQHLPGVGANLQDHLEMYIQQKCNKPITLYDKSSWRYPHKMAGVGLQWLLSRSGLGATSHLETGAFVRTDQEEDHPNVQFHFLPSIVVDHGRATPTCHAFQVHVGPMRPTSRGFVKVTSPNPRDPPAIDFNYLRTEFDRREMRDCVRIARRVFAQRAFDEFRAGELLPGELFDDDDARLDAFAAQHADSAYHPSCTCRMAPSDDGDAVVDPTTLLVYGTDNLRIVDASIMPSVVSGNLNGPVIMMAEKAADIIQGKEPLKPLDQVPVWSHREEEPVRRVVSARQA